MYRLHVDHARRAQIDAAAVKQLKWAGSETTARQNDRLKVRDLERGIAKLPEHQREVILLRGVEELSLKEIAARLNVPLGTVLSRLARGRDTLQRFVAEKTSPMPKRACNQDVVSAASSAPAPQVALSPLC